MDLQAIVSVVLANGNRRVQLWGRSMGAATSNYGCVIG